MTVNREAQGFSSLRCMRYHDDSLIPLIPKIAICTVKKIAVAYPSNVLSLLLIVILLNTVSAAAAAAAAATATTATTTCTTT